MGLGEGSVRVDGQWGDCHFCVENRMGQDRPFVYILGMGRGECLCVVVGGGGGIQVASPVSEGQ